VIRELVERGGEADETLRAIVARLADEHGWAGVYLVEGDELAPGPSSGVEPDQPTASVAIKYEGRMIGELRVARDSPALDEIADAIAPLCLVAWDTGGVPWSDLS
jgi:putative methionine-R-sulfoxide reductase with GAF domain